MPSRVASTHDTPQIPHTSLSFPSFIHPHLAAATASICGGLLAYEDSLYVARRERKDCAEDGLYSDDECAGGEDGCLNGTVCLF